MPERSRTVVHQLPAAEYDKPLSRVEPLPGLHPVPVVVSFERKVRMPHEHREFRLIDCRIVYVVLVKLDCLEGILCDLGRLLANADDSPHLRRKSVPRVLRDFGWSYKR